MKVKQLGGKARGSDELKKAKGKWWCKKEEEPRGGGGGCANYVQPKGRVQKNDTRTPRNLMKVRKRQMESGKRDRGESGAAVDTDEEKEYTVPK